MQYVLLIHAAESRYAARSDAENTANTREYVDYTKEILGSGKAGDLAALQPIATATCVQVRDGKRIVKDGPFAETREQLGGYYAVEAATEEEAIEWAAKIPDAKCGTIEVRPLTTGNPPPGTAKPEGNEYLLLIYDPEATWAKMSPADVESAYARYRAFTLELAKAGKFISGRQLEGVKKAKSVSVDGQRRVVRDGPFAETREQLGGYYRIYARDLDEAIALAAKIPSAEFGTIEVRPVMDTSQFV